MNPQEKIIFALDFPSGLQALNWADLLFEYVGMFKIGPELFVSCGPTILKELSKMGASVMLDLKFHDIPQTVENAIISTSKYDCVKFLTIHIQQRETLERIVKVANNIDIKLFGITILTSMNDIDCYDLGLGEVDYEVKNRINYGRSCGLNGFVCSAQEVKTVKSIYPTATIITPGIRLIEKDIDDQKRFATPATAIKNGADYLVIGRPIRDSIDPIGVINKIVEEIK